MKVSVALAATALFCASTQAQLPNDPRVPGQFISKSFPQLGRLTIMELLGDYLIAIPEIPSSPPASDYQVRALDISNPQAPVSVATFGTTEHPGQAHATYKRGNEVYLGGWPNNAVRLEPDGSLSHTVWSGPETHWNMSGGYYPWSAREWWSYNSVAGLAWLTLDGVTTAEWDHLGLTGVIGFPRFMGNLMIYASDQSMSGMASYDVSDPTNPVLLDVFNLPDIHPTLTDRVWDGGDEVDVPLVYGLGGYWNEIYSHYMVWARRGDNPGIQVVDFSDPENLRLHCEVFFKDPAHGLADSQSTDDPMYLGFQDQYIFAEKLKVNIDTCEVEVFFDERAAGIETGQYSRPIGNLLFTGGGHNWMIENDGVDPGGLGVWAHQAEPDTRPPFVAYHVPEADQTNYPLMAPISLMIPETLRTERLVVGEHLRVSEVGGAEVPIDYLLTHTGMLTVNPLEDLQPDTTYEVLLVGIEDAMGNPMERYSFRFSTGATVGGGGNTAPTASAINFSPDAGVLAGDPVQATVSASDPDGDSLEYRFRRSDGEAYGPWTASSSTSFTYTEPGTYAVTAQVRDTAGATGAVTGNLVVTAVPTADYPPIASSPLARSADGASFWVVNPDNDSLSRIAVADHRLLDELELEGGPRSVAVDGEGRLWVTLRDDMIAVLDGDGGLLQRIELSYGSRPEGIVIDQEGATAYVALYGRGMLLKIDTATRGILSVVTDLPTVKALALTGDGGTLLAARHISPRNWGEVWQIDTASMALELTIPLVQSTVADDLANGRGVPNLLSSIVIDTGDRFAYVVGKKDNTGRGLLNGNEDLDDDNTVRTFAAQIDLAAGGERVAARFDFDNADSPSALTLSPAGNYLFAALQGNNQVAVVSRDPDSGELGTTVSKLSTGLAPQGLLMDYATEQLFVKNFTGRSVTAVDVSGVISGNVANPATDTIATVGGEALSPQVLRGKQIFYNASLGIDEAGELTGRMSAEGYISCATCHLDGDEDGRVYDFTGRGEGLRNNISLNGSAGTLHGNLHWSGNFDEVQDFELDIRQRFLGRGLMDDASFESTRHPLGAEKAGYSEDLDALAAYVSSLGRMSLPRSPHRPSWTERHWFARLGESVFQQLECDACHSGAAFTDGQIHNVGTLREYSGSRLGEELPGIVTPPLVGLFKSAPYLHDGSVNELLDVFSTVGGEVVQAENATIAGAASIVSPANFSYLRRGAGVSLRQGGSISVSADSASERSAHVRLRYGSVAAPAELSLTVNGRRYKKTLQVLPQVNGEHVAFEEVAFEVTFDAGVNELTAELVSSEPDASAVIDDFTISTEAHEALAAAHTVVNTEAISGYDRILLLWFLLQLDQGLNTELEEEWFFSRTE